MSNRTMGDTVLIAGSPDTGAAVSFSQFVLPFAYALQPADADLSGAIWKEQSGAQMDAGSGQAGRTQRIKYFTPETAEVLFGSYTRRFVLDNPRGCAGSRGTACEQCKWYPEPDWKAGHDMPTAFHLHAPQLVLFEVNPDLKANRRQAWLKRWMSRLKLTPDLKAGPMQVGLLILEFSFEHARNLTLAQLCNFNERVRYFRDPHPDHRAQPLRTWLGCWLGHPSAPAENRTDPFNAWIDLLRPALQLGKDQWVHLFPDHWLERARAWSGGTCASDASLLSTQPMIFPDDRAFVWSAAVTRHGAKVLQSSADALHPTRQVVHRTNGWLRFLNVDDAKSSATANGLVKTGFEEKYVDEHSYLRWPETLYGFTPHSGIALLGNWNVLTQNFRCLYREQAFLLLYLRSVLFSFSRQISRISRRMQMSPSDHDARESFIELERTFSLFTNLYQFPLLSHQQQGVELYALQREALDINQFYREIQSEVQHMDELLDRRHDRSIRRIGLLIAVFATAGVIWDDFGLGEWVDCQQWLAAPPLLVSMVMLIAVILVSTLRKLR